MRYTRAFLGPPEWAWTRGRALFIAVLPSGPARDAGASREWKLRKQHGRDPGRPPRSPAFSTTGQQFSRSSILRRSGRDLSSCCPAVLSSIGRAPGKAAVVSFCGFSGLHKTLFIIFRYLKSHGATHGNGCSPHHPNSNMKSPVQPESENSGTIKPTPDVSSIVDQTVHHVGEDGPSTAACPVEPDPQSLIPQTVIITEAPSESAKP